MKGKIFSIAALTMAGLWVSAEDLVILHTNDTHSQIESDSNGAGGVLNRKAIIDSVRKAEKNVILVDAGDVVQGSLYFKFFKGDVEYPLMNKMGYDIQILGNHEFDNGLEELARHYKEEKATLLSANYDFKGTPLEGMFQPYVIREVDGRKIGFMGLNVDPNSLISKANYEGLGFRDIIKTANETAAYLKKKKKCDLVVAVTHIGYVKESEKTTDVELAKASRDIDIIIGGHSHTLIDPAHPEKYPSIVDNAAGKPVLIAQTGKYGKYLGYIKIDLDALNRKGGRKFDYELIPVTSRFPESALDKDIENFIRPYKHSVDSVNARVIAESMYDLKSDDRTGGYANWLGDFAYSYGRHVADSLSQAGSPIKVDMGFMNVGGIRQDMPAGPVTEGQILSTFPFVNRMVLLKVKGADIIEALRVAARKGGEAVSGNVTVLTDGGQDVARVIIDGKEMEAGKDYVVCTLDYVAEGNDDMTSWANGEVVWTDPEEEVSQIMRAIEEGTRLGLQVAPDLTPRFQKEVRLQ